MIKQSQTIEKFYKKYPNEWLLIAVDTIDEKTTTPLTGRLISHSPSREEIYKESITYKGTAMIDYSGKAPENTAFIF